MEGKLKWVEVSRFKFNLDEENSEESVIRKQENKMVINQNQYIEIPIYDILFLDKKEILSENETKNSNDTSLMDISLNYNSSQVSSPYNNLQIFDVILSIPEIETFSSEYETNIENFTQIEKTNHENIEYLLDLKLESKLDFDEKLDLDTSFVKPLFMNNVEKLSSYEREKQKPLFEQIINSDHIFPRGYSEAFDSPIIVLIGENEYDWHNPIIYTLKELYREISERYPKITFRQPELFEEGTEEIIDTIDAYSLEQFTFENKIEFLDAIKMYFSIDEFIKIAKGRLQSGFLQQFGILIIGVKRENLKNAKSALEKFKGVRIYTLNPNDILYDKFSSKIFGIDYNSKFKFRYKNSKDFFNYLNSYRKNLEETVKKFSVFVKRAKENTGNDDYDKIQYPLKVSTFVYLVNDLKNRNKKIINNLEELYDFIKQNLNSKIKVEEALEFNKNVIPDLIFEPNGESIYIEIETLIGTLEPMKKIDETVEKYKDTQNAKIWIILKPISVIIHYEELKMRKEIYKTLYEDKNLMIDFKVLTISIEENENHKFNYKWNLKDMDEFVEELLWIIKRMKNQN